MFKTTVFRNIEKVEINEVLSRFKATLEEHEGYTPSDVELLADIYAKNPTDKFIISEFPNVEIAQGDILIWAKGTEMYNQNINNFLSRPRVRESMVLQETDSITGDHRVIPLKGTKVTILEGKFVPQNIKNITKQNQIFRVSITGLIIQANDPFLIFHREHGNVVLPAGEYMVCSQMDPKTFKTMID